MMLVSSSQTLVENQLEKSVSHPISLLENFRHEKYYVQTNRYEIVDCVCKNIPKRSYTVELVLSFLAVVFESLSFDARICNIVPLPSE